MVRPAHALILMVPCGVLFAAQVPGGDLSQLYNGRQWIERRVTLTERSPTILRGAAATALNDPASAERLLRSIIHAEPRSDAANHAHRMLSQIYQRSGRYRQLVENLEEWSRAFPESEDVREARKDVERFRGLPNQVNGPRRRSTLSHDPGDISVPISINHKPAHYFFDTGAWVSAMTETEARRLGLRIRNGTTSIGDSSGRGVAVRMGVAREVVLGDMRFQNVSFAILPNIEPWASAPPGEGGILGIPILLAAGRVQWSKNGTVEFGGSSNNSPDPPNLAFEANHLLLQVTVLGKRVFTTFDTGALTTDFNSNFAENFADFVQRTGTKASAEIQGAGGTTSFDAIRLPEVAMTISATTVTLRPATLTLQRLAGLGGDCCVGNAGLDLLNQGQGFTIDFSSMMLTLE
jgi:predicted aspartyl protease